MYIYPSALQEGVDWGSKMTEIWRFCDENRQKIDAYWLIMGKSYFPDYIDNIHTESNEVVLVHIVELPDKAHARK